MIRIWLGKGLIPFRLERFSPFEWIIGYNYIREAVYVVLIELFDVTFLDVCKVFIK